MNKENLYVTAKGQLLFNYLNDIRNGEDYRIASFEEDITEFGKKHNVSREEVIEMFHAALASRLLDE